MDGATTHIDLRTIELAEASGISFVLGLHRIVNHLISEFLVVKSQEHPATKKVKKFLGEGVLLQNHHFSDC